MPEIRVSCNGRCQQPIEATYRNRQQAEGHAARHSAAYGCRVTVEPEPRTTGGLVSFATAVML